MAAEIVGLRPWNSILVDQKKNWVARACNGRQPSHAGRGCLESCEQPTFLWCCTAAVSSPSSSALSRAFPRDRAHSRDPARDMPPAGDGPGPRAGPAVTITSILATMRIVLPYRPCWFLVRCLIQSCSVTFTHYQD